MVTLRKYLYDPWHPNTSVEELPLGWIKLVLRLTDSIEEHVLSANTDADLREKLRAIRASFESVATEPELLRTAEEVSALIKSCRDRAAETTRTQSNDVYRILTTLNEALLLLAAGSTRTVGRLKQLETSLHHASSLNDIASLKSRLGEILTLIREEGKQERVESQRERETIQRQIEQIRRGAVWLRSDLPRRDEAVAMIEQLLQTAEPLRTHRFCIVVFVLGRIREIVQRYGDAAASELVSELVHRRVGFPGRDPRPFRWSPEAVIVCLRWTNGLESLNQLIEQQIDTRFEHKLSVGARVAVLRVGLHWVVLPVSGPSVELVEQIDRFAGGSA